MPTDIPVPDTRLQGPAPLDDPFYYLHNFRWVLSWVADRYPTLLDEAEIRFVSDFQSLPVASQGLLVRMVMRKGEHFRADKLIYAELGSAPEAALPLIEQGWVTASPSLDLEELFRLFTWPELRRVLVEQLRATGQRVSRKADALVALAEQALEPRSPGQWGLDATPVYRLDIMPLCDRLRVMFFGNAHQDWSEFVLTELGTYAYEPVEFSDESRPFHSRAEVDAYLALQQCREAFYNEAPLAEVAALVPALPTANPWLVRSRDKLRFAIAREWERAGEFGEACLLYQQSSHPEARSRMLRVLERSGEYKLALAIGQRAQAAPANEAEHQHLARLIPRLQRKLGLAPIKKPSATETTELRLKLPAAASVEQAVQEHLSNDTAPVHYVENTLLTGIFGLLCWDAVFAPLPGAFFHPFQRGPADLYWPDFYQRRQTLFEKCLQKLDSGEHVAAIQQTFTQKQGRQSPFVHWGALTPKLVEQALQCIPAEHLKKLFARFLRDLKANCAGLPDLVQFWPGERRYRLIEVKGPGDRLQDNQRRWLDFFSDHQIPAAVCYVEWLEELECECERDCAE